LIVITLVLTVCQQLKSRIRNTRVRRLTVACHGDISGTIAETAAIEVKVNNLSGDAVRMNGINFSSKATLTVGINTIEVTATNLAGTTTTVKRSMFYDNQVPTLAVIEPNQDIKTNKRSVLIKGNAADSQTAVTVTINDTPVSVGTDGFFEYMVELSEQKNYPILVKVRDEAGNETTVQRNIIYDTTAPIFSAPFLTPSNDRSQTVVGKREKGIIIAVECPGVTGGAVTYPTEESWSVTFRVYK
jgi:hypothetical protein